MVGVAILAREKDWINHCDMKIFSPLYYYVYHVYNFLLRPIDVIDRLFVLHVNNGTMDTAQTFSKKLATSYT